MDVGLLGGTFNPPHLGHLWVAQQALEDEEAVWLEKDRVHKKLDEVWFVPNAGLGHYGKTPSVSAEHRLTMCLLTCKDWPNIQAYDGEVKNKMEYTYQLIDHLSYTFPEDKFHLIIGGDWNITKFKNWEHIMEKCGLLQYYRPREGNSSTETPLSINFDLSSTIIRERVASGKIITGLVTPWVEKYIKKNNLYNNTIKDIETRIKKCRREHDRLG